MANEDTKKPERADRGQQEPATKTPPPVAQKAADDAKTPVEKPVKRATAGATQRKLKSADPVAGGLLVTMDDGSQVLVGREHFARLGAIE